MDKDALQTVAVAFLSVAVISVAASAIDSSERTETGGFGIGPGAPTTGSQDGGSFGSGGEGGFGLPLPKSFSKGSMSINGICIPFFLRAEGQLSVLLTLVGIGAVLDRIKDRLFAVTVTFLIAVFGGYVLLLLTDCGSSHPLDVAIPTSAGQSAGGGGRGGGFTGAVKAVSDPQISPLLLVFAGIVLMISVAAIMMTRNPSNDSLLDDIETEEEEADARPTLHTIGRMAGEAADRIDQVGPLENEVYRAWAEMTMELEVDHPDSSTPGEFARKAVDVGMAPEDVDRLTELFEEVRYGGRAATEDREFAAIETLRRIEDQYANEGGEEM